MSDQEIDRLIRTFRNAFETSADRAVRTIDLAGLVATKNQPLKAFELCREVLAASPGEPEIETRARRLLSSLVAGYHARIMNDPRRCAAWDRALRRAVRPGAPVLEIGTGAGLLAMMAARAGAGKVTACERNPVMAAIARDIVALNGFGDHIDVIAKNSRDLALGVDLDRPAELLFCDIFANDMLSWEPLRALADARQLLVPGAPVIPAFGAILLALGDWRDYERYCRIAHPSGFDMSPFNTFIPPAFGVELNDPGLTLLSHEVEAFRFNFAAPSHPAVARKEFVLEPHVAATARGIVQWTRIELDAETVLEARPMPGTAFYQSPLFYPFPQPIALQPGERVRVTAAHDGKRLVIWPIGQENPR